VQFVSGEKDKRARTGYALHSFILKMRSPVFAAMLEAQRTPAGGSLDAEPIELPEKGT
jgi:hypothetical protein